MISTKSQLKQVIKKEKKIYIPEDKKNRMLAFLTKDPAWTTFRYVRCIRKMEYYRSNKKSMAAKLKLLYQLRKKNQLGSRLGIKMSDGVFDEGLEIFHSQGIVINGYAKIGKNCKLHGNNCIGNNGITYDAPVLGDNVDVGYGACVIGNVIIADNIKIGAGAVVNKSCLKNGATLVGVPAHIVS